MEDKAKTGPVDCCKNPDNLEVRRPPNSSNPHCFIKHCRVCGKNHYVMEAQPGSLRGEFMKL